MAGEPPEAKEENNNCNVGLVFHPDGRLTIYEPGGWCDATPPYYAIGTGKDAALGAMFAGASAEEAVRAAVAHDFYTCEPITVLRHQA